MPQDKKPTTLRDGAAVPQRKAIAMGIKPALGHGPGGSRSTGPTRTSSSKSATPYRTK